MISLVLLFVLVITFISFFDFICCPLYAAAELLSNQVLSQDHYNNNDNENDEEENIENILERTECDVENQYDIMYQQWLNYNDI